MAYTALYRKKRPRTFQGVIGQPHVVRTLQNQLAAGHISHAYLFCGTRGTGKTSMAKIFSRAVNCMHPVDGEPCNTCEVCMDILTERNLGVIEIDAASNNGVDNIRDLREEVKYPPTEGQYKVYIIDEVHMLSSSAFNALLKTLEEPPPHVIFILATTDPQKIPPTILSRCQRYDFKRITAKDMTETIRDYLLEEDTDVEDDALRYIVSISDGAMRDALSILDQCLSFYSGETVTLDKVLALLGAVDRSVFFEFTDALVRFDSGTALTLIDQMIRDGRDIGQFTADLVRHFRDLLVASQIKERDDLLDYAPETVWHIKKQSASVSSEIVIGYIRAYSELQNELRYASHARLSLEVCTIRMCNPSVSDKPEDIMARLAKLEQALENGTVIASAADTQQPVVQSPAVQQPSGKQPAVSSRQKAANTPTAKRALKPEASLPKTTLQASASPTALTSEVFKAIQNNWPEFCKDLPIPLKSMLPLCIPEQAGGLLRIVCNNEATMAFLRERQVLIQEKLVVRFNLTAAPNLAFIVGDGYNKPEEQEKADDEWAALGEQIDMEGVW